MLGEDHSTLSEKLAKYSGRVSWKDLKNHMVSGSLVYVDPCLDLNEVGRAFAEDAKERVQAWMKNGDLVVPSQPHADYWESIQATFECQVVSPFVLIRPIEASS